MKADIITIGDEILLGQTVDSNSAFIASELSVVGFPVRKIHSIGDLDADITNALDEGLQNSDLIILTGGLGPTNDDITKDVLARYFNSKLVIHQPSLDHIKYLHEYWKVKISDRNINQALVPDNCEVLPNSQGSAPGMVIRSKGKLVVSLPGVPYEMRAIIQEHLIPLIKKEYSLPPNIYKTVLIAGVSESAMADKLKAWEDSLSENIKLAYLPSPGILKLRVSIPGDSSNKNAGWVLQKRIEELTSIIGEKFIFGFDADTLPQVIGELLKAKNASISVAESCSGGNIAHLITGIPGSSGYFTGSVTSYSNQIKVNVLGVSEEDIQTHGAVSKQVVEQMALGIKSKFNTDYSIATSGIAGPDGGTPDKPVGTTWIAVATPGGVFSQKYLLGNHRGRNIVKASVYALNMLRNSLV